MRVIISNLPNKYAVNAILRFENIFCSIQCVRFTSKIICLLLKEFALLRYRRKHHYRSFHSFSFQYCCQYTNPAFIKTNFVHLLQVNRSWTGLLVEPEKSSFDVILTKSRRVHALNSCFATKT
jgi:hypothetical protein